MFYKTFLKATVTILHPHHHPPTFKTKAHTSKHQSETFSLIHSNGCCITHSDKSGARPSLWQHHSLLQLLIQQPTMGKTRLFFSSAHIGHKRKECSQSKQRSQVTERLSELTEPSGPGDNRQSLQIYSIHHRQP